MFYVCPVGSSSFDCWLINKDINDSKFRLTHILTTNVYSVDNRKPDLGLWEGVLYYDIPYGAADSIGNWFLKGRIIVKHESKQILN